MKTIKWVLVSFLLVFWGANVYAHNFSEGEDVQVLWKGKWYNATVIGLGKNCYNIHYKGYSNSWDECVGSERIRGEGTSFQPETEEGRFSKGNSVMIEWRGSWYSGQILQILGPNRYKIHYDGYDNSWDEVVSDRRLKMK